MPTTVVHLVEELSVQPPASLQVPKRIGKVGRAIAAAAAALTTVAAIPAILLLWTQETPGWWFSLLFTVFVAAVPVVLWALLIGSIQEASTDRTDGDAWLANRERAASSDGRVRERHANLTEDGTVASLELTVDIDGEVLTGTWRPRTSHAYLFQSQIPGKGAVARVWRTPTPSAAPIIVEVADPTLIAPDASGPR